jgi:hypothetical protein
MFNWIPFDSVLFWIWAVGFCLVSIPVFLIWMVNSAFLGDSCDAWYRRKMFAWFTFLGFVMTWLWPIGLIGFGIYEWYTTSKQRKWNKKWAEKKATVPNYWKNYHLILNGNVTDIQVRILDWDYYNGKARCALWRGDSRFWADKGKEILVYWPNKDLQPIPEKEEKR